MARWLHCAAFALIGTLLSLRATRAQEPAVDAIYGQVLAEAMRAYQDKQWERAFAQFERAQALYPNARALRGMGVAAFENGWFVRAVHALEGALVHPEKPLSPELREVTELLASQARARLGTYRVARTPEEASLVVDEQPAALEPDGTLLLDPGQHTLRLEAAQYVSATRSIEVRGGELEDISMSLAPVEVVASVSSARLTSPLTSVVVPVSSERSVPLTPPNRDATPPPSRALRIGAWSAVGVGGAALVSMGALWWTGSARVAEIADHCEGSSDGCAESDAQARLNDAKLTRLERGINASLVVGVTALATAGVLWSLERFGKHKKQYRARMRGLSVAF